jgi:four helix bundle protein
MRGEPNKPVYDLVERTARFGEDVIKYCRAVPVTAVNESLIRQLVRAATSIGANYCEADDCDSRKDFKFKIGLCRRESRESQHWLRMIAIAHDPARDEARRLWREAKELNLIFGKIRRTPEK